ncbi:Holliday junction branch migration protein RuvA [Mesomycoplasma neurolyticum]|uniref:Holliday junction branch migration complex subunit RuvA n=1 Tax=Mesomycoplasma neurolyticum TaxID=2120 RepID=A0A449A6L6_9BACT|nr:Holliday junction branch migration protein RuvA [Mesomycoplasma neurolyticum]VEU59803.1 Holliday junction DNA helicase RuvA [Mesomycoplasma neurolyticum]
MEIYKIGKIVSKNKNYIILDKGGIGYIIYVANTEIYNKGEVRKVFVFNWENEYTKTTYGFDNMKERILFEDLLSINGIGPKVALSFLKEGWEKCSLLISEGNEEKIAKIPYISNKIAKQIVFQFQNKYLKVLQNYSKNLPNTNEIDNIININKNNLDDKVAFELKDTLKILGFKTKQIDLAISSIKPNDNFELLVEEAIKIISSAREFRN